MGRYFIPEEAQPGKDRVVIMTHRWGTTGIEPYIGGQRNSGWMGAFTVTECVRLGLLTGWRRTFLHPCLQTGAKINHDFHWLAGLRAPEASVSLAQAR